MKNFIFVEANAINISAKVQLYPPYGFWGDDFWIFFLEFRLSVALATNQIQSFGQNMCNSDYGVNIGQVTFFRRYRMCTNLRI